MKIDIKILKRINGSESSFFRLVMLHVRWAGLFWILLLEVGVILGKQNPKSALDVALLLAFTYLMGLMLKGFFSRKRPQQKYSNIKTRGTYHFSSFPSNETAVFMAYTIHQYGLYGLNWMTASSLLLTFIVGLSRVYKGAHYPSDVVGGLLLGSLTGYCINFF